MVDDKRIDELINKVKATGARRVRLGGFDIDGVMRGKYITLDKLRSALKNGLGFCDVIFGWDSQDALYEDVDVTLTGWHTGYPDLEATIDPDTVRVPPWDRSVPMFLLDFALPDGSPYPASPRQVFRRVLDRAQGHGYEADFAAEYEFFLFCENSHSVHEKRFRDLKPLSPGMFGYSLLRASTFGDIVHDLLDSLDGFGIVLEGIHTETGPGVYEACIAHEPGLAAADKAALFKTAAKEILARHGIMATFMAKISDTLPGCSGHVHQSLWKGGEPVFHDPDAPDGMSKAFRHYVAGLLTLLPEMMALYCPTINSYKRTVPGLWAPTHASWGFENRTAALRVIPSDSGSATRVENRLVGADMNAYLAFAASLGSGLWGIEHELELPDPVKGNAYEVSDPQAALPRTLAEATDRLEGSKAARELLGDGFVDHFVATRRWEVRRYEDAVTDWELKRYFEII